MAQQAQDGEPRGAAIESIRIAGFKSLADEVTLDIRPLTVLAGANSSGKTSAMQPLLLMKQTIEAPYDPGALLLDGPNVQFSEMDQIFSRLLGVPAADTFHIDVDLGVRGLAGSSFGRTASGKPEILESRYGDAESSYAVRPDLVPKKLLESAGRLHGAGWVGGLSGDEKRLRVERQRCFLEICYYFDDHHRGIAVESAGADELATSLGRLMHVPGFRGNPQRLYPVAAVGDTYPGRFEVYVASLLDGWQADRTATLEAVQSDLKALGLTWKVVARPRNATQIELLVGRTAKPVRGGAKDLVNIADTGFGISQVLPVVVALRAAEPDQTVYVEQPELHLHPRAQVAMAGLLADAATRGARVIVETHSQLILVALQALVAKGELPPERVILHWFERDRRGASRVTSGEMNEAGAYGKWPVDFGAVTLSAHGDYLDAAEARLAQSW